MIRKLFGRTAKTPPESAQHPKMIVGLGNPGKRYRDTRHNIGFMTIDNLITRLPEGRERQRFESLITETNHGCGRVVLVKPMTMMNNSGLAVNQAVRWYGVDLSELLVIHDDLDLGFGRIRMKANGGSGGHNGVSSVIQQLGANEFGRLRIGIGRPRSGSTVNYVLSRFSTDERQQLSRHIDESADAALTWVHEGIEKTMNTYNQRNVTSGGTGESDSSSPI